MAKKERLEDLGRLREMLTEILDYEIMQNLGSKHDFEMWKRENCLNDKEEDGLYILHSRLRFLNEKLHDCYGIALGDDE